MIQYRIATRTDHLWYSTRLLREPSTGLLLEPTKKTQIMADSILQVFFGQADTDFLELLASV